MKKLIILFFVQIFIKFLTATSSNAIEDVISKLFTPKTQEKVDIIYAENFSVDIRFNFDVKVSRIMNIRNYDPFNILGPTLFFFKNFDDCLVFIEKTVLTNKVAKKLNFLVYIDDIKHENEMWKFFRTPRAYFIKV